MVEKKTIAFRSKVLQTSHFLKRKIFIANKQHETECLGKQIELFSFEKRFEEKPYLAKWNMAGNNFQRTNSKILLKSMTLVHGSVANY